MRGVPGPCTVPLSVSPRGESSTNPRNHLGREAFDLGRYLGDRAHRIDHNVFNPDVPVTFNHPRTVVRITEHVGTVVRYLDLLTVAF